MPSSDEVLVGGSLSPQAWELYRRLVTAGGIGRDPSDGQTVNPVERELVDHQLASLYSMAGQVRLVPVAPAAALQDMLRSRHERLDAERDSLFAAYREAEGLQRAYEHRQGRSADDAGITVLTDPSEIALLSGRLQHTAERDFCVWSTGPTKEVDAAVIYETPRPEQIRRKVRFRTLCDQDYLTRPSQREAMRLCLLAGEEVRMVPSLPTKMVLVDDSSLLLPIVPNGLDGAALITAAHLVAAFRAVFEHYWRDSAPFGDQTDDGAGGCGLTSPQRAVVRLLLLGWKDEAIARSLDISARTVRRHLQDVMDRLGARTRIQVGAELTRRGWTG